MKNFFFLCMLVVITTYAYDGHAQWQNRPDTSFSNIVINDSALASSGIGLTAKNGNVVIGFRPYLGNNLNRDDSLLINGNSYCSICIPSDNVSSSSGSNLLQFAEDSDSTFVVGGVPEITINQKFNARARVTTIANPDSTELAISFYNTQNVSDLAVKSIHLNDSLLYLLVDEISTVTSVEVVLHNGQPQPGTALTDTGAAFLKIDRSTGAIIKQVYFNHNSNDGWRNLTHFNTNSLMREGNRFFFTSVSSLDENFMLHVVDMQLDSILDLSIATEPYVVGSRDEDHHLASRNMAFGTYNKQEYLGLIPKTSPVVVNLTTLDVNYLEVGSGLNDYSPGTQAAFFVDSAFILLNTGWIKRIELSTMTPSIYRRDWMTDSPTLDGRGFVQVQRDARLGTVGYADAQLVNGHIEYYSAIRAHRSYNNGVYINGEQITGNNLVDGDVVFFRGTIGLTPDSYPGTKNDFSCSVCVDSVRRIGNKIIYPVDSANLGNVTITRTKGPDNLYILPSQSDTIDFTGDTNITVFSMDYPSPGDLTTVRVYVESAVVVDTTGNDTTGNDTMSSLRENALVSSPLYPNPFVDYIAIPEMYRDRKYDLSLYDLSGKVIFRKENIGSRVHVSHLSSGVYIVHLHNDNNSVSVQKFVKQ